MTAAPKIDTEFIFSTIRVLIESDCFFCRNTIERSDYWCIHIASLGKSIAVVHTECFEVLAFAMIKFINEVNENPPIEGIN